MQLPVTGADQLSARHLRHKQAVRHPLLKMPDHVRLAARNSRSPGKLLIRKYAFPYQCLYRARFRNDAYRHIRSRLAATPVVGPDFFAVFA